MAGFITYDISSSDKTWSSANWVFVGYLNHVIEMVTDEEEVINELTECKHHQIVDLSEIEQSKPNIFHQIIQSFQKTCDLVVAGKLLVSVNGKTMDTENQKQYRQAVEEFSQFLERSIG